MLVFPFLLAYKSLWRTLEITARK